MANKKPALGTAVVYRAHADHRTTTVKTNPDKSTTELQGSVHHPEVATFAGLIGRVGADGSCDLVIFPPNRAPVWVNGVSAGDGDHEFSAA